MANNFLGAVDWRVGAADDYMGRARRRPRHGGGRHPAHHQQSPHQMMRNAATNRANDAASWARPDMPGTPSLDAAMLPASFPIVTFVAATGTNQVNVQMNPQSCLRGQRLIATVIRSGTSAGLTAPLINFLQVGMKPVILTTNGVALENYIAQSMDMNVLLPPTQPGVIYSMNLSLPVALTGTDSILCIVAIQGSSVL